jgi:transcription initiation factor TFIID TATA-box-binding protein
MPALPDQIRDTVKIENVVTSADIECDLDLAALHSDLAQSQYNVEQFPGLIYRSDDPKVTILVFRSGKIVCTGSQSLEGSKEALDDLLSQFDELGLEYTDPELTVQNIVGVADLGEALNLNAIAIGFGLEKTEYEPEQFPGLVYRMDEQPTVALIFGSGKMVITGGKNTDDVSAGVDHVYQTLHEYSLI